MKAVSLSIPGIVLLESNIFHDNRGYSYESFNQNIFENTVGFSPKFVQDNHTQSNKNVLRGLHYQLPPKVQGKLFRTILGEIFDVVVDIREESSPFDHWQAAILSADNKIQLWIPPGFAHGFLTLSETPKVHYKETEFYKSECERCLVWNDPTIIIDWPLITLPILSKKDLHGLALNDANFK